jgi:hypothetical protein
LRNFDRCNRIDVRIARAVRRQSGVSACLAHSDAPV